MLKESLIENNSILLNQRAADWKEAIKLGTDLLEKSGAIEPRYYTSIIENIEKMGPYHSCTGFGDASLSSGRRGN